MTGEELRLVDQSSATDSLPSEPLKYIQAIQRNHSEMVKFSANDADYHRVMNHLKPLIDDAIGLIKTRFREERGMACSQTKLLDWLQVFSKSLLEIVRVFAASLYLRYQILWWIFLARK